MFMHPNYGASGASPAAPERPSRGDATGLAGRGGVRDQEEADSPDRIAKCKQSATARAALAVKGHAVCELAGGGFIVTWRGLSRECRDLVELEAHARRVGVTR